MVPLVLVILGLVMGIERPASGLDDGEPDGTNTIEPAKVGANTQALEDPPSRASVASVTPEVFYYHQDATGNLAAMTDDGGQVVWQVDVRPFGQGSASSTDHPLRFAGQPQESDIGGLYLMGARVYDPVTGRFQSPDPILLAGVERKSPQRFNQYSYGLNNPYRYHDASGLDSTSITPEAALKLFLDRYEAKVGKDVPYADRLAAFPFGGSLYSKGTTEPVRNKNGDTVDLSSGILWARGALIEAGKDQPLWGSLTKNEIAEKAKGIVRDQIISLSLGWNPLKWIEYVRSGGKLRYELFNGRVHITDVDAEIRGADLIIDCIVFGCDLRGEFDPTQLPPKAEEEEKEN